MNKLVLALLLMVSTLGLGGCTAGHRMHKLVLEVYGEGIVEPQRTGSYLEGTLVEVEAVPAPGWEFYRWRGDALEPFAIRTTVHMNEKKTLQALFAASTGPAVALASGGLISRRSDGSEVALRPEGEADIEYIMLHAISDAVANPTKPFQMQRIQTIFDEYSVESHYAIDRTGVIYRLVEDEKIARHAGKGSWADDPRLTDNMNRYAIGIELLAMGTKPEMLDVIGPSANSKVKPKDRGYTAEQYASLDLLLHYLTGRYNIPQENIISHQAYDPGRKWDPGVLFDWSRIER